MERDSNRILVVVRGPNNNTNNPDRMVNRGQSATPSRLSKFSSGAVVSVGGASLEADRAWTLSRL